MENIKDEEFLENKKNRINVQKGEVKFCNEEDLESLGITLFDSKKKKKNKE